MSSDFFLYLLRKIAAGLVEDVAAAKGKAKLIAHPMATIGKIYLRRVQRLHYPADSLLLVLSTKLLVLSNLSLEVSPSIVLGNVILDNLLLELNAEIVPLSLALIIRSVGIIEPVATRTEAIDVLMEVREKLGAESVNHFRVPLFHHYFIIE